jgi:hypothetical protein
VYLGFCCALVYLDEVALRESLKGMNVASNLYQSNFLDELNNTSIAEYKCTRLSIYVPHSHHPSLEKHTIVDK